MERSVPSSSDLAVDVHLVLCDYGHLGHAYAEADPAAAGTDDVVRSLLEGEYKHPLRVIAVNVAAGFARDVSEEIAAQLAHVVRDQDDLEPGTRDFLAAHLGAARPC